MKTPIIRKPKFMRSDVGMKAYVDVAKCIADSYPKSGLSPEEEYEMWKQLAECIHKAAKAGGFFSTKDFLKCVSLHTKSKDFKLFEVYY